MKKFMTHSLIGAAVVFGTLAAPAVAQGDGGNSDAAHRCQQGGWEHVRRADGTAFTNSGDCVSYAAQGGVLTQGTITLSFTPTGDPKYCFVNVSLTGFAPTTTYTVENWTTWAVGDQFWGTTEVTTDATGAAAYIPYSFRQSLEFPRQALARTDSVTSGWSTISC